MQYVVQHVHKHLTHALGFAMYVLPIQAFSIGEEDTCLPAMKILPWTHVRVIDDRLDQHSLEPAHSTNPYPER